MIEIKDLYVAYDQPVLKGLNLIMKEHTVHGLLGRNGAGKTTLFRTILGLVKPSQGTIKHPFPSALRQNISLLESEPYFYPFMKGKEYLRLLNAQPKEISFWNNIFDLPLDRYAQHYSTGMKKKLAFMAVLIQDRPLWLLDEPFNGIDFETNEKMSEIIKQSASNKTILIASHIIDKLTQICDRISILDHGQISDNIERDGFRHITDKLRQAIQLSLQQKLESRD